MRSPNPTRSINSAALRQSSCVTVSNQYFYVAARAALFFFKARGERGLKNAMSFFSAANPTGAGGKRVEVEDLKRCSFSASALLAEGFELQALKQAGFDAFELREAGVQAIELRVSGFGPKELFEGGFSASQVASAGWSASRLQSAGYEAIELKEELKLDCSALRSAGYRATELRRIGFIAADLKAAGFSAREMLPCCPPPELSRAGFVKSDLKPIGAFPHDGTWNSYNCFWSCCHSTDSQGLYCQPTKI